LKKKKQKNFCSGIHYHLASFVLPPRSVPWMPPAVPPGRKKVFLLLFFQKKKTLAFLALSGTPPGQLQKVKKVSGRTLRSAASLPCPASMMIGLKMPRRPLRGGQRRTASGAGSDAGPYGNK